MQERLHMTGFVLALIPVLAFTVLGAIAIWRYLDSIGTVIMIVFIIVVSCGCWELISLTHHRHSMRKIERTHAPIHSRVIEAAGIAAYVNENDTLYHLSAYNENAKTFPVQIEETTKEVIDEVKMYAQQGLSERAIAGRLNIPRNQVRRLLGK